MRSLTPRQTLVILTGLNLFNYFDRYVLSAVLPSLQSDLKLDDSQAGHLATVFMLGYFLTSPFFGWLGDRFGRRPVLIAGWRAKRQDTWFRREHWLEPRIA